MSKGFLSNPTAKAYDGPRVWGKEATFSVQGAAAKSLVLLVILSCTFAYTWQLTTQSYTEAFSAVEGVVPDAISIPGNVTVLAITGSLLGFLTALVIIFKNETAPYLSPVYAALQGLSLGAISAAFEAKYPGIALQATASTIGVTLGMLLLYTSGILRPTQGFMTGLLAAMFGILALYLIDSIMILFGSYVPIVHSFGPWGIALQFIIVGVAALSLIPDFGLIAKSAEGKASKSYEWYAAFSLMVTLVWLYLEIIKLIAKVRSSDD